MRRIAVLLLALFLVNLPVVHETLTERRVARDGREVTGQVLEARRVDDGCFLDLRLPEEVDPDTTRVSARVDSSTCTGAQRSRTVEVRAVPGDPGAFRVAGQVGTRLFAVVAVAGDLLFLVAAVVWWRRRRWRLFRVVEVDQEVVVLSRDGRVLSVLAPERWLLRTRPGQRVAGALHLVADQDVVAAGGDPGLEARQVPSYVVRGRVLDVAPGVVRLEVDDALRVAVQTGPHRNRADLRELATAAGTLHFTPGI